MLSRYVITVFLAISLVAVGLVPALAADDAGKAGEGSEAASKQESARMIESKNEAKNEPVKVMDYLEIDFLDIYGDTTNLADFSGKVLLLVNVASKCGFTPQYEGLQKLYETYKDSGLVVIGFPANNFRNQEPGTDEEILEFCSTNFGVTFPMMSKISVKGEDKHPLYVYLTEHSSVPGEISWNFNKFLLDRSGNVVARFQSQTEPMSDEMIKALVPLL